jgi:hypothetical protein
LSVGLINIASVKPKAMSVTIWIKLWRIEKFKAIVSNINKNKYE